MYPAAHDVHDDELPLLYFPAGHDFHDAVNVINPLGTKLSNHCALYTVEVDVIEFGKLVALFPYLPPVLLNVHPSKLLPAFFA